MSATKSEGDGPRGEPASAPSVSTASRAAGWWHVNKGGFPIPEDTWEKMWRYVRDHHPNGQEVAKTIRGQRCKKVSELRKIKQTQPINKDSTYIGPLSKGPKSLHLNSRSRRSAGSTAVPTRSTVSTQIHITSHLHMCIPKSSIYMYTADIFLNDTVLLLDMQIQPHWYTVL